MRTLLLGRRAGVASARVTPEQLASRSGRTGSRMFQFMNFRGYADLELALQAIALRLPPSIDVVVGIPRSGLLAATMLALQLNVPVTDVSGFLEGRLLTTGRRPTRRGRPGGSEAPHAVVVDDSLYQGKALRRVKAEIEAVVPRAEIVYAVAFVTKAGREMVDLYGEVVDMPRAFSWNILHHPTVLKRSCVDIDGVLCVDPAPEANDDGPEYRKFLASAQALFLPSAPVKYVVTSRLEKYRSETEHWLGEHGVEYERLVMLDLPDAATRQATQPHARHKADFYVRSGADLFVESDYRQAVEIASRSGRQVFAIDRREMIYPSVGRAAIKAPAPLIRSVASIPPAAALAGRVKEKARAAATAPKRVAKRLRSRRRRNID